MYKKIIIAVIALSLIGLGIFFLTRKHDNKNELELFGNIEIRQVDLSFQVSGQIVKMLKEEGDFVKKGELLAILDDKDYKINLEKASADIDKALVLKNDANSKYERNLPLCAKDIVSKQDCETLLHAKDKTNADYNSALAQKTFANNQLSYTKIYAPEDGIITVRVQENGATVAKGQPVYTMAKTKPIWIRAYVNETDLGNIKYGMSVKVYTDTVNQQTGKKREYNGYIGYISPVAEFTPKTVQSTDIRTSLVYRIRVYVNDIDEYLRQGMPTTIKIDLSSKDSDEYGRN